MGAGFRSSIVLAVAVGAALVPARAGVAVADAPAYAPVSLTSGKIVLPLSGLQLTLPRDKRKGFSWQVTSSYSVGDGNVYDARDVVDEKVKDKLVGGNWVLVGHFNAGDCGKVVGDVALTEAWSGERDQWGVHWFVRGGVYQFEGELGKRPALVMCASRKGRKQLLLYHFFVDRDPSMTRKAILAALPRLAVLERATRAWQVDGTAGVTPLRRAEVRQRGAIAAARTLRLPVAGRELTFPDDGFVWGVNAPEPDAVVDWIWRAAPALPEQSLEVVRVPGATCAQVFAQQTSAERSDASPRNLPAGWQAGPAILVDGELERTACHEANGNAVVVGLQTVPDTVPEATDFAPLTPLLGALAAALAN